jgi:hypothetical protein
MRPAITISGVSSAKAPSRIVPPVLIEIAKDLAA